MRPLYQTSFWLPIHLITFYGPVAIRLFAPITYIFIGATSSVQVIVISLSLLACIALKILYAEIVQYFGSTHNRTLLVATYSICVAGSLMVVTVYILQKGNLELKSDCKILVGDNNHLKMSDICKKKSLSFCALTEFDNLFLDNGDETSIYKVNFVLFAILESAQDRTIIALQHKNIIGNHIMINLENIYYKNDQNDNEESTKIEPVFVGYCVDSSNINKKLNNCLLGVLAVFFMVIFSSIIQTDFEVIRNIEYKMHQNKRYLSFEVSFLVRELSFTFFAVLACFLYSTVTKNTTNQYNRILLILICLYTVPLLLSIYNMVFFSETYTDVGLTYFIRTPFPLLIKMFSPRMIVFGIFCTFIGFGTLMMELLTLIKSSSYGFKLQYFGLALIIRFIASIFPSFFKIPAESILVEIGTFVSKLDLESFDLEKEFKLVQKHFSMKYSTHDDFKVVVKMIDFLKLHPNGNQKNLSRKNLISIPVFLHEFYHKLLQSWASYKQKFTNWFQEVISSIHLYALLTLVPKYAPKKFSKLTDMNSDLDGQISLRNYEQAVDKREKLIVLDYIDQVGPIVYDKNMKAQILQLSKYVLPTIKN